MSFMYYRFPWDATPTSLDLMDLEKSDLRNAGYAIQVSFTMGYSIVSHGVTSIR